MTVRAPRQLHADEVDRRALAAALRAEVEGEVRFDTAARALYATDASNYRQVPIGVVVPRTIDDVVAVHRLAREHGAPIVNRGGGTALAGQGCNVAVLVDFSKYLNGILDVDPVQRLARIQPGLVLDHLRGFAEKNHQLTFGPDPSTHAYCTLGGMLGNNSCGRHSVMSEFRGPGSRVADHVVELEVLTYRGDRLRIGRGGSGVPADVGDELRALVDRLAPQIRKRYPQIPRRVSGYNLDELLPEGGFEVARSLVGTESTCVTILEATLELIPAPKERSLLVIAYPSKYEAADHVPTAREHEPDAIEGVDDTLITDMTAIGLHKHELSLLPEGHGWLLVEFGGDTKDESDDRARALMADLEKQGHPGSAMKLYDDPDGEQHIWDVREAGLGATAFIPGKPDTHEGWEDSAVPPERLGEYLRRLDELARKYEYESALYGHYGQGCVHARWNFDLLTREGVNTFRHWLDDAADLVLELGGSLSGEHGDGQSRAALLPKMFGDDIVDGFREFKRIWDPDGKMNPGKVVDAYGPDENLRLGPDYRPWRPKPKFAYPKDHGDFAHATQRCVGIGKCRTPEGVDVMCPSFMATREEMHSTRGRTRLLFEMLRGEVIEDGWQSDEVMEALDLCLSCKGCTKDCPVGVDMPTMKSEFLHHRWQRQARPRHAYAFGLIDRVAVLGSRMPEIANALGRLRLVKLAAGMAPERETPTFAPLTLQEWFARRGTKNPGGRKVVLFPDTFNNRFHTEVGVAAVEAIEAAGWQVVMPQGHICCGRPLYDYGFLDLAERYLRHNLDRLREWYREGIPIVGMEPSCTAVFKDELGKLIPNDEDATRLCTSTYHFAEFFRAFDIEPPLLERKAFVWGHCHQKASGGMDDDMELLQAMGVDAETLTSGCCGLAGSWGFEDGHYDLSQQIGEIGLLPKVRSLPDDTLVVANGFSCKTQIEQGRTGRRPLHVAQLLALAREGRYPGKPAPSRARRALRVGLPVAAATALAIAGSIGLRR
ncbi:MAG: FAD-binding oxidoreductase [Actinobacteria bacterium]|nr:FAD-binding oxidoreductase [Actinomycetota bacterium]